MANHMTCEAFLDEVTTLITEKYDVADKGALLYDQLGTGAGRLLRFAIYSIWRHAFQ